ncbi:MAG: DUF885 domain-containing protein [Gammaproteobacteria bacterium]|nr:DUF885 domain-containing protein [Gammaproteobacteria bacterium]
MSQPGILRRSMIFMLAAAAGCNVAVAKPATPVATQAAPAADPAAMAAELERLYGQYWQEYLELNPVNATFVGDPRYNDRLPDFFSARYRQQTHDFNEKWLNKVAAYDSDRLAGQARLSQQIFVQDLRLALEGEKYPDWQQPLNQFYGFPNQLAMLGSGTSAQPFKTVGDYDDWLERAGEVPVLFDSAIANMRMGMKSGVVQPEALMVKVLPQLDSLIKEKPEETLFWTPITELPAEFPDADKKRLTDAYRTLIADKLMPSYRKLRDFVRDEYLAASRDTVALSALPDGQAWYAYNVRLITTTELSPARIHEIGLAEVARIHGEMRAVMKEVGFDGDLQAFFEYLTTDEKFEFDNEEAMLTAFHDFDAELDPKLDKLFSRRPEAGFELRPVEEFRAASAAAGSYQMPSEDGTRPGIFYLNTHDLPSRKTWDVESLYLHEAKPGHHFQIAIQQELTDLPMFRRFGGVTAFAEGWGLYAESLGRELGAYQDPYQYFGRLQAELWRAIRLIVDTGLHSKGWTREQVIAYMKDNSATSDTNAVAEAERYIAIPGQALAYKIGELKILELRSRAEEALGNEFDVREFHAEVLRDGAVPLDVLEAKVDQFIAAQRES